MVIDWVAAPVDQTFPVVDEDVSVIEEPAQNADGPLIVGVAGIGFTATLVDPAAEVQPLTVAVTW